MRRLLAVFALAQTADLATTLYGVHHGAHEQNAVGVVLLAQPALAVLAKVALVLLAASMLARMPGAAKLRRVVLWITVVTFVVAGWNVLQVAV